MISIVIPTFNEAAIIGSLVTYLWQNANNSVKEIILADGGSTDGTAAIAEKAGALVIISPQKGRAAQMNHGASFATGSILYFIHADSLPPQQYSTDILTAIKNGYEIGRYRTKFNKNNFLLKANAFFTRFDWEVCYGGDQTLFVSKNVFEKLGGYNSNMFIMEEYDFTKRAKNIARYIILKDAVIISARKYTNNSWWSVQNANYTIVKMYKKGATQEAMVKKYKQMLNPY